MSEKHSSCLGTLLKISVCLLCAGLITIWTWLIIVNYPPGTSDGPTTPPPCMKICENGGLCSNDICICPDKWFGELCTQANFCENSTECISGSDGLQECLTFGEVLVGRFVYSNELCEDGSVSGNSSKAFRQCTLSGGIPALQNLSVLFCDVSLQSLANLSAVIEDPSRAATSTQILTSRPEELDSADISHAIMIVNQLLDLSEESFVTTEAVESTVTTISQIMDAERNIYDESAVQENAESLTETMERIARNSSSNNLTVVQPNVAIQNSLLYGVSSGGVLFTALRGVNERDGLSSNRIILQENVSELQVNERAEVQIFVSRDGESETAGTVGFVLYQNDNFFRSKSHHASIVTQKRIISASISSGTLGNIYFTYNAPNVSSHELVDYTCVYWDYEISDWNTKGCFTVGSSRTNLQCICNHTTNFAVLMSFKYDYAYVPLEILSTVGCALSIVGLAIAIIVHLYQRFPELSFLFAKCQRRKVSNINKSRQNLKNKWITLCLFSSMLIFNIIFISGVENNQQNETEIKKNDHGIPEKDKTDPPENPSCTAVAFLLHYFLLATFFWTAVSAAVMYFGLINVRMWLPSHFIKSSLIVAWGFPALFVSITFGATYHRSPYHYRQEEYCWLAAMSDEGTFDYGKPMFWSFLVPVGIILAFNISIFVTIIAAVLWKKEDSGLRSNKEKVPVLKIILKKIWKTLSVTALFGITWIFGYLMLSQDSEARRVFSFIFCICTATQGLQIFIFHTLYNKLVLEKLAAFLRLFKSCRIYMHSERYFVNKIRKGTTHFYRERFRLFQDSTDETNSNNNDDATESA